MTAIVFDLDGTLIDSAPDICHAANLLLADQGLAPLTLAEVRKFIGNGTPKLVERVQRARDLLYSDAVHAQFMVHYMADPIGRTTLYPGVLSALTALQTAGHTLAICTNKPEAATVAVLEAFNLAPFMQAVVGGDTLPVLKPNPAPLHEAFTRLGATTGVFVGDSDVDAATAKAANLPFGLYTEGYRKSPVNALTTTFVFSDFRALPGHIAAV